jgi:hypothetical protein
VDTDKDGLDDLLEQTLGFNKMLPDSDADGFGDALELHARSNPMDPHSTPLHAAADPLHQDIHTALPMT